MSRNGGGTTIPHRPYGGKPSFVLNNGGNVWLSASGTATRKSAHRRLLHHGQARPGRAGKATTITPIIGVAISRHTSPSSNAPVRSGGKAILRRSGVHSPTADPPISRTAGRPGPPETLVPFPDTVDVACLSCRRSVGETTAPQKIALHRPPSA